MDSGFLTTRDSRTWERLLRQQDIKGDIPDMIAAHLQPTLQLENYSDPEYAWLRRTRRHTAATSIAAVAGQYSIIQFRNSNTAGATIIRTRYVGIANPNAGGALQVGVGITFTSVVAYSTLTTPSLDDRQPPTTALAGGNIGVGAQVASLTEMNDLFRVRIPIDSYVLLDIPFILTGRGFLTIHSLSQNVNLMAGITYDERDALSSET
jgi:hypothetical protein